MSRDACRCIGRVKALRTGKIVLRLGQTSFAMKIKIRQEFNEKFQVYGALKVWRQLLWEGYPLKSNTGIT